MRLDHVGSRRIISLDPEFRHGVPPLWPLEVANVLLVAERRRRITRGDVARFLDLLADLPLAVAARVAVDDMSALVGLGRDHALSAYDAAYLHLALQEHLPLATRDRALRAAARSAGVAPFITR